MNQIRTAQELRTQLLGLFSYILLSAPDFPEEDGTTPEDYIRPRENT